MFSGMLLADCEFVAVDLETTGSKPGRNSIIEVGAVRFRAASIVSSFERLVRPDDTIPHAVEELTHITAAMVARAPSIDEVMAEFREFAAGAVQRRDLAAVAHRHAVALELE